MYLVGGSVAVVWDAGDRNRPAFDLIVQRHSLDGDPRSRDVLRRAQPHPGKSLDDIIRAEGGPALRGGSPQD